MNCLKPSIYSRFTNPMYLRQCRCNSRWNKSKSRQASRNCLKRSRAQYRKRECRYNCNFLIMKFIPFIFCLSVFWNSCNNDKIVPPEQQTPNPASETPTGLTAEQVDSFYTIDPEDILILTTNGYQLKEGWEIKQKSKFGIVAKMENDEIDIKCFAKSGCTGTCETTGSPGRGGLDCGGCCGVIILPVSTSAERFAKIFKKNIEVSKILELKNNTYYLKDGWVIVSNNEEGSIAKKGMNVVKIRCYSSGCSEGCQSTIKTGGILNCEGCCKVVITPINRPATSLIDFNANQGLKITPKGQTSSDPSKSMDE